MATRSLRNRVSSRYTSPAAAADTDGAAQIGDGQADRNGEHISSDEWVEPPVRKLPPSYQDHRGLERLGVLEMQEPLGVPPSQKLLQKLKLTFNRSSPRPTPMQTEGVSTPGAESEKVDMLDSPVEAEVLPEIPAPEETVIISSPPRGRPAKRDLAEMRYSSYTDITPSPVKSSFTPSTHVSPKPVSIQEHLRQDRLQNWIERAIEESDQKGDPGLIPGLRKIRETARSNSNLWKVLDNIVNGTSSEEDLKIFKRFIKRGVKKHMKGLRSPESSFPLSSSVNNMHSPRQTSGTAPEPFPTYSPSVHTTNLAPTFTSPFRPRQTPPYLQLQNVESPQTASVSPSIEQSKVATAKSQRHGTVRAARHRSGSASSSSSLSSAKSIPDEYAPGMEVDGEAGDGSGQPGQRQGTSRVAGGNRLRATGDPTQPASRHPFSNFASVNRLGAKRLKRIRDDADYDPAEVERLKTVFQNDSYRDYNTILREEVNERHHVSERDHPFLTKSTESTVPPPMVHPNSLPTTQAALSSPISAHAPELALTNGTSRKRHYEEIDRDDLDAITPLSPSPGPLLVPPPPAAVLAARSATPRAAKLPANNKARKSARVMVSPNKPKNGGITAGISRAGPRDTVIGNGADSGAEDNDEYCASCGGEGKLLCCDGCTNSFHHACLEPPLDPEQEVDGEWFCPSCLSKRNRELPATTGLLGPVIRRVDDTIPKAFALPLPIRDYFEGVRTGDEGEYEEVGLPRTRNNQVKLNRAGFIDEPNYKDVRDAKGKLITCYQCGLTADGRDIIPCDFCPARWHLDCVDPPLAVPPRRRIGDKPNATWRCPLHAEHDLSGIARQAEAAPGDLGRVARLRKPKNAIAIDVQMSRGFRNNGMIEVDLMKDDMPEIKEIDMGGGTFRLPERGIRLDFIDRVKKSWYEDQSFPRQSGRPQKLREKLYRPDGAVLHNAPQYTVIKMQDPDFFTGAQAISIAETAKANVALRNKSFKEQQTILSLASLQGNMAFSGDALADLTNQLVADAPTKVTEAIQRGERDALRNLQELIAKRLAVLGDAGPPPAQATSSYLAKSSNHGGGWINGDHDRNFDDYDDYEGDGSEMDISD